MSSLFKTLLPLLSLFSLSQVAALPQASSTSSSSAPLPSATTVHRFPNGTWVENFAIRKDGSFLCDFLSAPEVVYVDSSGQEAKTVARFPAPASSVFGITELGDDIFYVATSFFSFTALGCN